MTSWLSSLQPTLNELPTSTGGNRKRPPTEGEDPTTDKPPDPKVPKVIDIEIPPVKDRQELKPEPEGVVDKEPSSEPVEDTQTSTVAEELSKELEEDSTSVSNDKDVKQTELESRGDDSPAGDCSSDKVLSSDNLMDMNSNKVSDE